MSTPVEERWSWLCWLAHGYFGEDWPEEHNNATEVIDEFLAKGAQFAPQIATEIQEVLDAYSEADLPSLFEEFDLLVDPGLDLNTYRGWLTGVHVRISSDIPRLIERVRRPVEFATHDHQASLARWPALVALGAGWFQTGWQSESYWSTRLVIEAFMFERPDLALALPDEIDEVLAEYPEEELGTVLSALGINYDPVEALNTNRGWLTEVARRVQRPIEEQS